MTQTPDPDHPDEQPSGGPSQPLPPPGPVGPPPAPPPGQHQGWQEAGQAGYGPGYGYGTGGQPGYPPGYPSGYGDPGFGYYSPEAPYGVHPGTGLPYSDKSKLVAGLLQILLPLGIGRMYLGYTGMGVAQLLVTVLTCGIGSLWPFIDGIVILVGDQRDPQGRILRT